MTARTDRAADHRRPFDADPRLPRHCPRRRHRRQRLGSRPRRLVVGLPGRTVRVGCLGHLLDLTAFPAAPSSPTTNGVQGAGSFSAGWGCAIQCITKGVAYPGGFGAELVVETSVEADLFVSVIGDADGDGDYEYSRFETSDGADDHLRCALDDLDPGQTYYAMVSAVDSQGGHSLAYGELTTLSHRDAYVSMGDVTITGGKDDDGVRRWLAVDGWWSNYTPGSEGIHLYSDLDGTVDLRMGVSRDYDDDLCGALPTGYGEPYFFRFSAPVTFFVSYR